MPDLIKKIVYIIGKARANKISKILLPLLKNSEKILDIGAGTCNITEILIKENKKVIPLDIKNLSCVSSIKPLIYDGNKIPFEDDYFDTALIICVLHHTNNQEALLKEAKRVAKNVIVIEDIYKNRFHYFVTKIFDTLINLDWENPYKTKSDKEWKETFKKLNFKLKKSIFYKSFLIFNHVLYNLSRNPK
jgi:ubiquinone/menaquinone biosynthesis C-methylase UbiE